MSNIITGTKVTDLTIETSPTLDDVIYIVDKTTNESRQVTLAQLKTLINS